MSDATRQTIKRLAWKVDRAGTLDEVHMDNGGVRWNVRISDAGRKPFISRWFNDPVPASDFLESFLDEGGHDGR